MYPIIGRIGPFFISSYGLIVILGVILCTILMCRDGKRAGIKQELMFDFILWQILGGIVGARLLFIFLNSSQFTVDPNQMFTLSNGGLAWYGGLVLACVVGVIFVRIKGLSLPLMMDFNAPYLALGQAIVRVGCFLNGCCYGKESSLGIYFSVHNARLLPTQLYDVGMLVGIFFILKVLQKRLVVHGEIFCVYLMLASVERFISEFFRGDHSNTAVGLSIFQLVSLVVFLIGFFLWRRLYRQCKVV